MRQEGCDSSRWLETVLPGQSANTRAPASGALCRIFKTPLRDCIQGKGALSGGRGWPESQNSRSVAGDYPLAQLPASSPCLLPRSMNIREAAEAATLTGALCFLVHKACFSEVESLRAQAGLQRGLLSQRETATNASVSASSLPWRRAAGL